MSEYQEILLGQILNNNDVWHRAGLVPDHFINPWARQVFQTISALIEDGKPANIVTVSEHIQDRMRVIELPNKAVGGWEYPAQQIREEARHHHLTVALKVAAEKLDGGANTDEVLAEIEDDLVRIALTGQEDVRPLTSNLQGFMEVLEERYKRHGELPGILTGYPELDRITGGMEDGMLWYLGARPSQGKSTLLLNMLTNAARGGARCGLISLESSEREAYTRIFSNVGNIQKDHIRIGLFKPSDFQKISDTTDEVKKWQVWVCDNPEMTAAEVKSVARKMVIAHKVEVIFIDYLQYIREDTPGINRAEHVASTSRGLKAIARQLQVPVVAAAQLKRDVDERSKSWPRLSDFAESSQTEKDADVAILLHDDKWFCVAKNRDGQTCNIEVTFDKEHARFEENQSGF